MIKNPRLRALVGMALGAAAGASLCLSILPLTLYQARIGDETVLARMLMPYVPHVAMVWVAGGWGAARVGFPLGGGAVMALAGLASALFAVWSALEPGASTMTVKILAVGGLTGLVYGFLGGLLLGRVLATPGAASDDDALPEVGKP